jgi:uncharacterized membrane protein
MGIGLLLLGACGFENLKSPDASADGSGTPKPIGSAATFTEIQSQILRPKCVSCHGSGGSANLASYAGFATNTRYVVPGNAQQSLLYTITQSGSMPPGGSDLTTDQLNMVQSWIEAGAQND